MEDKWKDAWRGAHVQVVSDADIAEISVVLERWPCDVETLSALLKIWSIVLKPLESRVL